MPFTFADRKCPTCSRRFVPVEEKCFVCPDCMNGAVNAEATAKYNAGFAAQHAQDQLKSWQSLCPSGYRESDKERVPPALQAAMEDYTFGPRGLGFVGPARIGKTTAMFRLLARFVTEGRLSGAYIYGPEFASEVAARGAEFAAFLKTLAQPKYLFFDDVGAGRVTPAVESNFLLLLESRSRDALPTFWTSNLGPSGLERMFSKESGPRVIGRLKDFSDIVQL